MKWFVKLFGKAEILSRKVKESILFKSDPQFRQLKKWNADDIHNFKKTDFPFLGEQSLVFDLGGYEGQWSSDIYSRYNCTIHVFEPASQYATLIKQRFQNNKKIHVHAFGLARNTEEATMLIDKFSSKIVSEQPPGNKKEIVKLVSFDEFLVTNNITTIDLIKINIEGAEFDLLEFLISSGTINKIKCLLIQFHNFIPNARERREKIQTGLATNFKKKFDYPFIWECWIRKE